MFIVADLVSLSGHSKRTPKYGFQYQLSLNAGRKHCRMLQGEHSAILSTFISLHFPLRPLFCLFLSGQLRQVLLYLNLKTLFRVLGISSTVFWIKESTPITSLLDGRLCCLSGPVNPSCLAVPGSLLALSETIILEI